MSPGVTLLIKFMVPFALFMLKFATDSSSHTDSMTDSLFFKSMLGIRNNF